MRAIHCKFILLISLTVLVLLTYYRSLNNESPQSDRIVPTIRKRNGTESYNVWCIFVRSRDGRSAFRTKFLNLLVSILKNTELSVSLHVITDAASRPVARDVVEGARTVTGEYLNAAYYDVDDLAQKMEGLIGTMKGHFSSQPGAYYSSSLFFISIGLHKVTLMRRAVMIDVDTFVQADIADLFDEFDNFGPGAVLGAAPELTPVYHHILYTFRARHKGTKLGSAHSEGGFPGVNSGVLLLDLDKMRHSTLYQRLLVPGEIERLVEEFKFKGHLGDQDFYTLAALKYPALVHLIDCGWNRQLCTWWKDHGYRDSFHTFAACDFPTKIYHGNCNTNLPSPSFLEPILVIPARLGGVWCLLGSYAVVLAVYRPMPVQIAIEAGTFDAILFLFVSPYFMTLQLILL